LNTNQENYDKQRRSEDDTFFAHKELATRQNWTKQQSPSMFEDVSALGGADVRRRKNEDDVSDLEDDALAVQNNIVDHHQTSTSCNLLLSLPQGATNSKSRVDDV
jgi:hypothetical protein